MPHRPPSEGRLWHIDRYRKGRLWHIDRLPNALDVTRTAKDRGRCHIERYRKGGCGASSAIGGRALGLGLTLVSGVVIANFRDGLIDWTRFYPDQVVLAESHEL